MFRTRLISGIVLVALLIFFVLMGNYFVMAFTMGISVVGMFELYRALKLERTPMAIAAYIMVPLLYILYSLTSFGIAGAVVLAMIVFMFFYVFSYPKYKAVDIFAIYFGYIYVALMLFYIYMIRSSYGIYFTFLVFVCSWGCDTMAYCVGMLCSKTIGTHKMAPVLSPKKSIEGAIGGVAGAALLTFIYLTIFKSKINILTIGAKDMVIFCIMAAIAGLVSMVGDLTASAIKRNYEIKDYGRLIPGHGGILDRFDSVIIISPIIFYTLALFYSI